MAQVKYQISLAVDGNHSVSVSGDDKEALKEGLSWAKRVLDKLVAAKASPSQSEQQPQQVAICAHHHSPMKWMVTGKGSFWSCHRRNPDGSWCSYRPADDRKRATPASAHLPFHTS
jgi:hypothetical protein